MTLYIGLLSSSNSSRKPDIPPPLYDRLALSGTVQYFSMLPLTRPLHEDPVFQHAHSSKSCSVRLNTAHLGHGDSQCCAASIPPTSLLPWVLSCSHASSSPPYHMGHVGADNQRAGVERALVRGYRWLSLCLALSLSQKSCTRHSLKRRDLSRWEKKITEQRCVAGWERK